VEELYRNSPKHCSEGKGARKINTLSTYGYKNGHVVSKSSGSLENEGEVNQVFTLDVPVIQQNKPERKISFKSDENGRSE